MRRIKSETGASCLCFQGMVYSVFDDVMATNKREYKGKVLRRGCVKWNERKIDVERKM